jgi:hypothetical protein
LNDQFEEGENDWSESPPEGGQFTAPIGGQFRRFVHHDNGTSIIQTTDGNYTILGHFRSNDGDFTGINTGGSDICVFRINSSGEIIK